MPVLGDVANEDASPDRLAAFKKGLSDLGYVEGTNLKIEYRYAKLDRKYDAVMVELVSRKLTSSLRAMRCRRLQQQRQHAAFPLNRPGFRGGSRV